MVHYSWTFFHLTFALASLYLMELLTDWGTVSQNTSTEDQLKIATGMASLWVKIVSSWFTLFFYAWTVVAPLVMTDRDFY